MSTICKSKNYNSLRERKEWEKNPNWELILKEIIQNIPWSPTLRNILVRITKLTTPTDKDFRLEVLDDDYGCLKDTFENSLLKEETKDGFVNVTKDKDNRFGQGIQNSPQKTSDRLVYIEMKRDGIITSVTMQGDEDRTREYKEITESQSYIKTPSGFYITLNFTIPSQKKKVSTVGDVVDIFYNVLKNDCKANLKRVDVKMELVGFDKATNSKYKDKNKLEPKIGCYYTDESLSDTISDKPYTYKDITLPFNSQGDEMYFSYVKLGKRVGEMDAMKRFGINEETYLSNYDGSEFGDKPRVRVLSETTGLPYWVATFPNSGKSNRNGADIDFYINMQDEVWEDGSQTKNPFLEKGGLMENAIITRATEMWEEKFPSETDSEDALQKFLFTKFTENPSTKLKSIENFFERIGLGFYNELSESELLEYIVKEDSKGAVRFDFSLKDKNKNKIPIEVKPNPFKASEFRQALDYYMLGDDSIQTVVMIGCGVSKEKISDFNDIVDDWKDGKMSSNANFVYISADTEFGYDANQKIAYIKEVQKEKAKKKK